MMNGHEPSLVWDRIAGQQGPVRAATADGGDDPFARFPDWICAHVADGGTLLDVGCGYGRLSVRLAELRPRLQITAIDGSAAMLNAFRSLLAGREAAARITLVQGVFPPLPFDTASFDMVISSAVLLHNPYATTHAIIAEMARVLKPGGRLLLVDSFPYLWNGEGIANFMLKEWSMRRTRNGPVRPYSRRRLRAMLADFIDIEINASGCTLMPRKLGPVPLPGGRAIRSLNLRAAQSVRISRLVPAYLQVTARAQAGQANAPTTAPPTPQSQ